MTIHFIAIGGSVMHQLAIALHKKGFLVTGSDDEIFDPAYTNLFTHTLLPAKMGWDADKIHSGIDAIILGMHAKKDNPELLKAQQLNIAIYAYPLYIYEYAKEKQRVVIGGSHGKTTITSMIMHTLNYWQQDFDYLVGAKLKNFQNAVKLTKEAKVMLIEGDEYLSSPIHLQPKFHFYQPNIALLSGIAWDHINVFPSFADYVKQFQIFVQNMTNGQTLIYNQADPLVKEIAEQAHHLKTIPYVTLPYKNDKNVTYIPYEQKKIKLKIFGEHNIQNLSGAKIVCNELGISDGQFFEAIQSFEGAARRLEFIAENEETAIYKDFAHAPSKVKATTASFQSLHQKRTIVACLELHTYSSLNEQFLPQYKHTLNAAEEAIVFFNQHTFELKRLPVLSVNTVKEAFDHPNIQVFTNKSDFLQYLKSLNYEQKDLLLMSSGNFGGVDIPKEIVPFVLAEK